MSIIRAKRRTNFTVVSNCVYADDVLSFRAMGLLGYLLAKPDDWEVSVHQLAKATKNTKRPMGADAIRETLNELIEAGFVRRKKRYTGEMDYFVFDEPQAITADDQTGILPNREKAKQGKSQTGILPNREKPDVLINTERPYQELKKDYQELNCGDPESGDETAFCDFASEAAPDSDFTDEGFVRPSARETVQVPPAEPNLPAQRPSETPPAQSAKPAKRKPSAARRELDALNLLADRGVDGALAQDYMAVRKDKRAATLTKTALAGLEREANRAGLSLAQAVTLCCERGWVGFRADWLHDSPSGRRSPVKDVPVHTVGGAFLAKDVL
nr:MAG TPA: Dna polymerase B [Caudoviricetes sp.]